MSGNDTLAAYRDAIAYPGRARALPSVLYSKKGLTVASYVTVKNIGAVPVSFTLNTKGGNNNNATIGTLNVTAALLGDIIMDGADFLPEEILKIRGEVSVQVQTGGTQYPTNNLERAYFPANGGSASTPAERFLIRPGSAIQVRFRDLDRVTEYSYEILLAGAENLE